MRFAKILEVICFLAWFLVALLVDAVLNAWVMSALWRWFAAPQYGAGPTLGAWFGVALIARLILRNEADEDHALKQLQDTEDLSLAGVIKKSLWSWAGVLFTLGVAWCLGTALHWIR